MAVKRFFVRVQLHDVADGDDAYDDLHEAMEVQGFGRTIKVNGEEQHLPWGTYIGFASKTGGTKEAASSRVSAAVKTTGYTASFVVIETDVGVRVNNLDSVEQPKSLDEELDEIEAALEDVKKEIGID